MLSDTGFKAGHGKRWGVPATEIAEHSDLVVVWGTNPVHTHVNLMTHIARARKERGAKLVVVDPYRSATAEQADMHLALRPGTDGALACGVMHVLFAEGLADRDYLARYSDVPDELERHLRARTPAWAVGDHRPAGGRDPGLRPPLRRHQARVPAPGLRLHPLAQRGGRHARRLLPAGGDRRLAAPGRRRALQFRRALSLGQDDDRGPGRPRSLRPPARPVADRPDPGRRARRSGRRRPGPRAADPEHQPDVHRARARQGAPGLRAGRPVRGGARAVHDRHRAAWPTSSCRPPCSSSTPTSTRPARTRRSRSTSRSSTPFAECRTNHFVICELARAPGCRASRLRHDRVGADRRSAAPAPAGPTPRPSTPPAAGASSPNSARRTIWTASRRRTAASASSPTGRASARAAT